MDFLKAEIERKRKLQASKSSPTNGTSASSATKTNEPPAKRYKTRSEREQEQAAENQQQLAASNPAPVTPPPPSSTATTTATSTAASTPASDATPSEPSVDEVATAPVEDVIKRLRELRQPVTLFAETAGQRERRLKQLELQNNADLEYKSGSKDTFGLDLKKLTQGAEDLEDSEQSKAKKEAKKSRYRDMPPAIDGGDDEELAKLSREDQCLTVLKRLMHEWECELDDRSDAVRRSAQGKIATATFKQTQRNLRPLFKCLRRRTLPQDIALPLLEIVQLVRKREYLQANKAYLTLAIGNAPWPMGVTMVGIHERSAREKISSNQVAHVLNDETQRKYIQGVKRLMSFAQSKYNAPPSKMIG